MADTQERWQDAGRYVMDKFREHAREHGFVHGGVLYFRARGLDHLLRDWLTDAEVISYAGRSSDLMKSGIRAPELHAPGTFNAKWYRCDINS